MTSVLEGPPGTLAPACAALAIPRASVYRHRRRQAEPLVQPRPRPTSARALSATERQAVLDTLHEPRFVDQAPAEVFATLLDEGVYLCSIRTMYRILDSNNEVCERRKQRRNPVYKKPELLAEAPNVIWSWDVSKLKGPAKWTYFYLYVIMDIFSRRVVGWCVEEVESAALFAPLFEETVAKHDVPPGQLTLHADRGGPMKAKPTAHLLADLGVTKSHSRPHTSNDNPFSEACFKTLKYQPKFPQRFDTIDEARAFCRVLSLVQCRPPSRRHRPHDPQSGPLRPDRCDPRPSTKPSTRPSPKPRSASSANTRNHRSCRRRLDQSARAR